MENGRLVIDYVLKEWHHGMHSLGSSVACIIPLHEMHFS